MTKHVFETTRYGTCEILGELVKETEHFFTVSYRDRKGNLRERRRNKTSGMRVIETDDPAAIVAAYDAAWKAHEANVEIARAELRRVQHEQSLAVNTAAFGSTALSTLEEGEK